MKILINYLTDKSNLKIEILDQEFLVNGKKAMVDVNGFVRKLLKIVSIWEENMVNNLIVGGDHYEVKIKDGDMVYNYVGYGKYPINYHEFVALIGGLE